MSPRQFLNRFRHFTIPALIIILIVTILYSLRPKKLPDRIITARSFFIDEETGEESLGNMGEIPPLLNKAGKPTLVKAHYYTCQPSSERRLSHLEKYTDEGKVALLELYAVRNTPPSDALLARVAHGTLYRRPEKNSPWVPADNPEALAITNNVHCPPETTYSPLLPPKGPPQILK